jgi:hypothetical protein
MGDDGQRRNDALLGMSQPGAAGALLSTGEDLVRWSMALAGGKVVAPATYASMTEPLVLPDGRDTHYAFGLMIADLSGHKVVHHGGGIDGFNSMLLHVVPADLHVAVISNGERASSDRLAKAIARAVLGIRKPAVKDEPIPAELQQKLVGEFDLAVIGRTLAITAKGGAMFAQVKAEGQNEVRLLYQGELEFRPEADSEVKLVFTDDGKQLTLHQGDGAFVGVRQ